MGYGLMLASLLLMLREVRISRWLGGVEHMTLWHHYAGIAAYLLPAGDELSAQTCYLCGPPGLIVQFIRALRSRGVPDNHIHFERFDYR